MTVTSSKSLMTRIVDRVQRRSFSGYVEKQDAEYLARFNWNLQESLPDGTITWGTILIHGNDIYISGEVRVRTYYDKKSIDAFITCFESNKPRFESKGFKMMKMTSSRDDRVGFSGNYDIKDKLKITENDLDYISDFMHNSFACILKNKYCER